MITLEEQDIARDFKTFEVEMQRALPPDVWESYITAEVIESIKVESLEEAQRIIDERRGIQHE